ncbi:J domain-containing protein [Alicyclobacillus herbarius]|uniref:J domain-containing protein n=1 Tax=Alicyclobacillus herbarius TaxID=122960 RepID=UPI0009D742BA|nr:J domain-containing protein [Alicyclobacillus herbarius]
MAIVSEANQRLTTCPFCQTANRVELGKAKQVVCGNCKRPLSLTFYDVLGVAPDASAAEIRRQFRRLVQVWHPDKAGIQKKETARLFQAVLTAYRTLSNPEKRQAYDAMLALRAQRANPSEKAVNGQKAEQPQQPAPGRRPAAGDGTHQESPLGAPTYWAASDEGTTKPAPDQSHPDGAMDTVLQVFLNALIVCAIAVSIIVGILISRT